MKLFLILICWISFNSTRAIPNNWIHVGDGFSDDESNDMYLSMFDIRLVTGISDIKNSDSNFYPLAFI